MLSLIPKITYLADCATRRDHVSRLIDDERAYVATILARTRDFSALTGLYTRYVALQPSTIAERRYGIDGVLLIRAGDLYKALAFEAKRPRFMTPKPWDNIIPGPLMTRFHRQLTHQKLLHTIGWVTGGLFISDIKQGNPGPIGTDSLGSTFIPWEKLYVHSLNFITPGIWDTAKLIAFMGTTSVLNFEELLVDTLQCRQGTPLTEEELIASVEVFADDSRKATKLQMHESHESESAQSSRKEFSPEPSDPTTRLLRRIGRDTSARGVVMIDLGNDPEAEQYHRLWRQVRLDRNLPEASDGGWIRERF